LQPIALFALGVEYIASTLNRQTAGVRAIVSDIVASVAVIQLAKNMRIDAKNTNPDRQKTYKNRLVRRDGHFLFKN
jgi:hypothetical protein